MRRFLFLAFIMFLITGGAMLFSGEYDAASPGSDIATSDSVTENGQPYFLLYRAMELAEAGIQKGEIHYWASLKYDHGPLTEDTLELLADTLLERLAPRFVPAYTLTRVETNPAPMQEPARPLSKDNVLPDLILVEREGQLYSNSRMRFLLQGMENGGDKTVHLFIIIVEEGEARRLGELARRIPALLNVEMFASSLSFSLTGRIPVKMDVEDMEKMAVQIAGRLGARNVESILEDSMVSITGNTPLLNPFKGMDAYPVNLNLALRNDNCNNSTMFWIGTPIISGMY